MKIEFLDILKFHDPKNLFAKKDTGDVDFYTSENLSIYLKVKSNDSDKNYNLHQFIKY